MRRQTRVPHVGDARVVVEEGRDPLGVALMLGEPERQGDRAAGDQPCVERRDDAADVDHRLFPDLRHELRPAEHGTAHGVAVPVDVLGQRMDDEVRAVGERTVQSGRREGGVDEQQGVGVGGDLRQRADVGDLRRRIGDRLGDQHAGAGAQGGPGRAEIADIDKGRLDPVLGRQQFRPELPGGLVGRVGHHHVVPGGQEREEHRVQRGHARGQDDGVVGLFQRGQLVLQRNLIGAGVACVEQLLGARPAHRLGFGREVIRVRHRDRRPHRRARRVVPGVHAACHLTRHG